MMLNDTGSLIISVFGDGKVQLSDWRHIIRQKGAYNDVALPIYPVGSFCRLRMAKLDEHPEMPGWLTGSVELDIDNQFFGRKPITLYGLDSEYWSCIVHFPLSEGFPFQVISVALRADFEVTHAGDPIPA